MYKLTILTAKPIIRPFLGPEINLSLKEKRLSYYGIDAFLRNARKQLVAFLVQVGDAFFASGRDEVTLKQKTISPPEAKVQRNSLSRFRHGISKLNRFVGEKLFRKVIRNGTA